MTNLKEAIEEEPKGTIFGAFNRKGMKRMW